MNSVTVYFINSAAFNGSTASKTFSAPVMTLSGDQFWFTVLDENSLQVAMIPREQILYVETNFNTAP